MDVHVAAKEYSPGVVNVYWFANLQQLSITLLSRIADEQLDETHRSSGSAPKRSTSIRWFLGTAAWTVPEVEQPLVAVPPPQIGDVMLMLPAVEKEAYCGPVQMVTEEVVSCGHPSIVMMPMNGWHMPAVKVALALAVNPPETKNSVQVDVEEELVGLDDTGEGEEEEEDGDEKDEELRSAVSSKYAPKPMTMIIAAATDASNLGR